jgi:hypothetical protein
MQGMFKIVIGGTASMHGVSVGKEMGITTWAAFTDSDNAAFVDDDSPSWRTSCSPCCAPCARKVSTSSLSTST